MMRGRGTVPANQGKGPEMTTPATALSLKIGRKAYPVASYEQASEMFSAARDRSGLGSSDVPNGRIFSGAEQVAYISYNGKVWAGSTYQPAAVPLFVPR